MNLPTPEGIALIKRFEGFRREAYPDPLHGWNVATIGYGTTVYADGLRVRRGDTITEDKAEAELTSHVLTTVTPALKNLPYFDQMHPLQIAALESFAYNLGAGFYNAKGFETISRKLSTKDWGTMRQAFMLYVNPGTNVTEGLKKRRAAEADLWEEGVRQNSVKGTTPLPVAASHPPEKPAKNGPPGQLSAHFTLTELTVSQTAARKGIPNTPGPKEIANLERLCDTVLEPLRVALGKPVVVTSGYRGPELNRAIGGAKYSAHMYGRAADIHVPGMTNDALMRFIHSLNLPVDQVIEEFGSWVHVGIAEAGSVPRKEYLIARSSGGGVNYTRAKL